MTKISHLAIIMDGNRRWAKERGQTAEEGHAAGVEALEKIVRACSKVGVEYLTVYALSTENLSSRSKIELSELFNLIQRGIVDKLPILKKEGIRIKFIGDTKALPLAVRQAVKLAESSLASGKGWQLNVAINYGSRAEIVRAVERMQENSQKPTEESLAAGLDTAGIPDPDLLIRTGGVQRLSNFLLWQSSYTELYFTDTLWPDFDEKELDKALAEFEKRQRNFGA